MKKLIPLLALLLVSCVEINPKPIEKYKGAIIISNFYSNFSNVRFAKVKTTDSIFEIIVTQYDADRYVIGDTIK